MFSSQTPPAVDPELQAAIDEDARLAEEAVQANLARLAARERLAAAQQAAAQRDAAQATQAANLAVLEAELQALQEKLAAARSGATALALPPTPTPAEVADANAAASTSNWESVEPTVVSIATVSCMVPPFRGGVSLWCVCSPLPASPTAQCKCVRCPVFVSCVFVCLCFVYCVFVSRLPSASPSSRLKRRTSVRRGQQQRQPLQPQQQRQPQQPPQQRQPLQLPQLHRHT